MSMSVSSFSTLSTRKGIGGLASGLDTETLIEQMTSGTRAKITSKLQQKERTTWKRDAYREVSSKMMKFSEKYFSYSNMSTNILSKNFFNVAKAISSNEKYVKISGDANAASKMQIRDIKQLASFADFTTTKTVSKGAATSGQIQAEWKQNTLAGKSLSLEFGGTKYNLSVNSSFYLDSHANEADMKNALVADLNNQVQNNPGLKDQLKFECGADGVMQLKQTGTDPKETLRINGGDIDLLTSLGFAADDKGALTKDIMGTRAVDTGDFFRHNSIAGSTMVFELDGKTYTATIDSNYRMDSGNEELSKAVQAAIDKNEDLKGKITASVGTDGKLTLTGDATTKLVSSNEKLGLKSGEFTNGVLTAEKPLDLTAQVENTTLKDSLSGHKLTIHINGKAKMIYFDPKDAAKYTDAAGTAAYMQEQMDKAYGAGVVTVDQTGGKLSMKTVDASSVLTMQAADAGGILGVNGALHMMVGESNRMESSKTLDQMKDELGLTPDADGKYKLTINDVAFEFTGKDMFGDVLSKINRSTEAGITIAYNSVTDNFHVTSTESGSKGRTDISDTSGNLAGILLGVKDAADGGYKVNAGKDAELVMSFDGGTTTTTITRSDNTFSIDGVGFELVGMSDNKDIPEDIRFTVESNADELFNKIKTFITDYNEIIDWISKKTTEKTKGQEDGTLDQYLPLTDEQAKDMSEESIKTWTENAKLGLLHNDQTLYKTALNFRGAMGENVGESKEALYQIGIATGSYTENGHLNIDEEKLKKTLLEDPEKVVRLFTSPETGIASRLKTALDDVVGLSGDQGVLLQMAGRDNGVSVDQSTLTRSIKDMNTQLATLKERLQTEEDRYWKQFTQLEKYMSTMNSQSDWLTQQMTGK